MKENKIRVQPLWSFTWLSVLTLWFVGGCEANGPQGDQAAPKPGPEVVSATREKNVGDDFGLPKQATVAEVIDGDTVRLDSGEKVRLIGVDTPETVHPSKPVEAFGKEASAFTRQHLEGEEVRLEYDEANVAGRHRDRYGRLLAYIFRERDGLDFNAALVHRGYAHAYTNYPFKRVDEFRGYEREAREARRGLWATGSPSARAPPSETEEADDPTVYVTRTGSK